MATVAPDQAAMSMFRNSKESFPTFQYAPTTTLAIQMHLLAMRRQHLSPAQLSSFPHSKITQAIAVSARTKK
jgi:hypothetical protein